MERSKEMIKLGCAFSNPKNIGGGGRGSILDPNGICQTVTTMSGGGNKPFVLIKVKDDKSGRIRLHR